LDARRRTRQKRLAEHAALPWHPNRPQPQPHSLPLHSPALRSELVPAHINFFSLTLSDCWPHSPDRPAHRTARPSAPRPAKNRRQDARRRPAQSRLTWLSLSRSGPRLTAAGFPGVSGAISFASLRAFQRPTSRRLSADCTGAREDFRRQLPKTSTAIWGPFPAPIAPPLSRWSREICPALPQSLSGRSRPIPKRCAQRKGLGVVR